MLRRTADTLAWKYHDDFDAGILANAMVGEDNCHRGAVVGSLLGAANGVPAKWLEEGKVTGSVDAAPKFPVACPQSDG